MGAGTTIALIKALAKVDPAAIEQAVSDWLEDHPEATTTVEDGSITKAKLASALIGYIDEHIGDVAVDGFASGFIVTKNATVDITSVTSSSSLMYKVLDCVEGDMFIITGTGGSNGRAWCFIDSSGNSLAVASDPATESNSIIVAPKNAAKLVVNLNKNSTYGLVKAQYTDIMEALKILKADDIDAQGFMQLPLIHGHAILNKTSVLPATYMQTSAIECGMYPCVEGDWFTVKGYKSSSGYYVWAFHNASGETTRYGSTSTVDTQLQAQSGEVWFTVNFKNNEQSYPYYVYKGRYPIQRIYANEVFEKAEDWYIGGINSVSGRDETNVARLKTLPLVVEPGGTLLVESLSNTIDFCVFAYNTDGSYDSLAQAFGSLRFRTTTANKMYVIVAKLVSGADITDKSAISSNIKITMTYSGENMFDYMSRNIEYRSALTGKRWAVCGDSYSAGAFDGAGEGEDKIDGGLYAGRPAVYSYFIGNRTGMDIRMLAKAGMTLAKVTGETNSFINVIGGDLSGIPADADYITFWFGINDKIQEVPIGADDSTDTETFNGAWNTILTNLRNDFPFAHVGIIISNSSGSDALPYAEATIAMAKKYGYPYLDLMYDEKLPMLGYEPGREGASTAARNAVIEAFSVDYPSNTHPNKKAHEFESHMIEEWLKSI